MSCSHLTTRKSVLQTNSFIKLLRSSGMAARARRGAHCAAHSRHRATTSVALEVLALPMAAVAVDAQRRIGGRFGDAWVAVPGRAPLFDFLRLGAAQTGCCSGDCALVQLSCALCGIMAAQKWTAGGVTITLPPHTSSSLRISVPAQAWQPKGVADVPIITHRHSAGSCAKFFAVCDRPS